MRKLFIFSSAALLMVSCGSAGSDTIRPASTAEVANVVDVRGTMTVAGAVAFGDEDWPTCTSPAGYSDVIQGGTVTVTDPAGKVVGLGSLGEGQTVRGSDAGSTDDDHCVFSLEAEAPGGLKFYGVEVGHRGVVQFAEADLAGPIRLTLG